MEVGFGQADWVPRQEMRLAELVATFIEVGADGGTGYVVNVVVVEC